MSFRLKNINFNYHQKQTKTNKHKISCEFEYFVSFFSGLVCKLPINRKSFSQKKKIK